MLKVGITGGIGSGKSLVCRILESLGYSVFYSDKESKLIKINDQEVRSALIARYGHEVYNEYGVNKKLLSEQIFKNPDERLFVNSLIHPKVREAFEKFAGKSAKPLVFNEAAILFETGSYKSFDRTILVTAPEEIRIDRVIQRDNFTRASVQSRIDSQWKDEEKSELADGIIINDGVQPLIYQLENLVTELIG